MYVCGPTVQARPHVGHGRAAVSFDVIRRHLTWRGYEVTYVQNITDVEDKIIASAAAEGVAPAELAARYAGVFADAYRRLGVGAPDIEPRATEHIPEMIELIEQLIAKGHAYEAGGDVYFAVRSFPRYGALSGRDIDELLAGARVDPTEHKRDPLDFAVWKTAKPGEPRWPSPWGPGRPGWHIECSAMARKYLGPAFDIHAGGADLIFPHHENEIAQTEAAFDTPFCRYWLHNGLVNLKGEKMAKSTGHVVDLIEALDRYPPQAIRLFYLRTHYRRPLEFSDEAMADAIGSLDRLWAFRRRIEGSPTEPADPATLEDFATAMSDDFDTAGALAVVFDTVREANRRLDAGESAGPLVAAFDTIVAILGLAEEVAGLDDLVESLAVLAGRFEVDATAPHAVVDALVQRRTSAREAKEWATADTIRDELAAVGIVIEDVRDGSRWHRR